MSRPSTGDTFNWNSIYREQMCDTLGERKQQKEKRHEESVFWGRGIDPSHSPAAHGKPVSKETVLSSGLV